MPVEIARLVVVSLCTLAAAACDTATSSSGSCTGAATGGRPFTVVAHRGWLAPTHLENSLREMRASVAAGVTTLEIDLRASRDGTLFLLHDATLDRTTTGTGRIDAASDAQLSSVTLTRADGTSTGEPLPRFDAVMAWARSVADVELMLDIKGVDLEALAGALVAHELDRRSIILTFDAATTTTLLRLDHQALVSVLVASPDDIGRVAALAPTRRLALYVAQDADPTLYTAAAATGLPVVSDAMMQSARGTLDDRAERGGPQAYRDHLASRGVRYLVTNRPVQVRTAVCGT